MAYAERFAHDLFVSYAEADDQSMDGHDGWVTAFVKRLRIALTQRLGGQLPDVYFGNRLQANQQLDEILKAVRRSGLFLAVGSRAFIEREWTNLELNTFVGTGASTARIFLIECMPPWPEQKYPNPIETHRRLKFHSPAGQQGKIDVPLSPVTDSARFNGLVHDLAHWVSEALRLLKTAGVGIAQEGAPPAAGAIGRTVLVAQTTDDLEDEATSLSRYLSQFGIRVLPAQPYPQGGAEFAKAFRSDLEEADIFVQLLGLRAGRAPRDLPDGYTIHQHAKARERKLDIYQWREPAIDPKACPNDAYRQLLDGPNVIVSGLEVFKAQVKEVALAPKSVEVKKLAGGLAFIDAEQRDIDLAKAIQVQFNRQEISTILPMLDLSSAATRADLEENLIDSDVLVFIYGNSPPEWIRSQLRLYNKIRPRRASNPRALAICIVPPHSEPELGMSIPGSHVIELLDGDIEPIKRFLNNVVK
jgi:hypothetical protein